MSNGPEYELQAATFELLIESAAIKALLGSPKPRIFDHVPTDPRDQPEFPYVTFGEAQEIPNKADCVDGSEIYLTFHIWSRKPGYPECKQIAEAISKILDDADLTMPNTALVLIERDGRRFFRDPDGMTSHGVLTFRALTEAR